MTKTMAKSKKRNEFIQSKTPYPAQHPKHTTYNMAVAWNICHSHKHVCNCLTNERWWRRRRRKSVRDTAFSRALFLSVVRIFFSLFAWAFLYFYVLLLLLMMLLLLQFHPSAERYERANGGLLLKIISTNDSKRFIEKRKTKKKERNSKCIEI